MDRTTRVLLVGGGRMGTLLREQIEADSSLSLVGVIDVDSVGTLSNGIAPAADLVVDFSHRDACPSLCSYVRGCGAALLSGTTGLTDEDLLSLRALGEMVPVTHASNYSLGIAVLRRLVAEASSSLAGWDVEIVECHHNKKADAPSGTALALLAAVDHADDHSVVNGRQGLVGARRPGEIGMHAIRGGTVAGVHEVMLFGSDEELCLTHRATSRQIFVSGALAAARRLLARKPGFYTFDELMFDDGSSCCAQ